MKLYKVTQESLLTNMEGHMGNRPYGPPGVGITFFKRLDFVFYVIIKIIIMAAFFHIDTSITPTTVLSVQQLILNVWPW